MTKTNHSLLITWKAPFTLNITNTEPDVTYCINILNISNGHNVVSVCNSTATEFLYTHTSEVLCHTSILKITVTPINGAGQGISEVRDIQCKAMWHDYYY